MVLERTAPAQLPVEVVSGADVARLRRELETVDEKLRQEALRHPEAAPQPPRIGKLLQALLQGLQLDAADEDHRQQAIAFLNDIQKRAPTLHFSFARDPSADFLLQFVSYLRQHIHPQVLVSVGLMPTIAAGCILRTPNHQYDLSLRSALREKRGLLVQALEKAESRERQ